MTSDRFSGFLSTVAAARFQADDHPEIGGADTGNVEGTLDKAQGGASSNGIGG